MDFQPDSTIVANYVEMLENSMSPDPEMQKLHTEQFETLASTKEFCLYLGHVFSLEVEVF